jgi:Glycosyltransferase family 87
MQRVIKNIILSKAPVMVVLRYLLIGAVILMGLARLRITLLLLASPENYKERDILQLYLMAKSLVSGLNPYLQLNLLAEKFIGPFTYFPHPAPYPPFDAILFSPLLAFNFRNAITIWYILELLFLFAIACLITVLWKGRLPGIIAIILFFIMLAWYPVMADLAVGQLSILLTLLFFAILLAINKSHRILAGIFIGLSIAIKVIAWPLIIYFIFKKDWKVVISSVITTIGLNLIALVIMGSSPFFEYYLHVSTLVTNFYEAELANFSIWSTGYRLFTGTGTPIFAYSLKAPALFYMPEAAPLFSFVLAIACLIAGLILALKSKDSDTGFAIIGCIIVAISPIFWDHYFVILIMSMVIMIRILARQSFPLRQTLIFVIITLLYFLFNERIYTFILSMNGGNELVRANGNQISFTSSLIAILPMIELLILTILLWQSGMSKTPNNHLNP